MGAAGDQDKAKDMRGHLWNVVFKVHRYAPDYPGLAGRDLAPQGVIELPASQKGKTGLDNQSEEPRPTFGSVLHGGGAKRCTGRRPSARSAPPNMAPWLGGGRGPVGQGNGGRTGGRRSRPCGFSVDVF